MSARQKKPRSVRIAEKKFTRQKYNFINTPSEIYGLVLSGGQSRRMGTDKALISYYGKPQREHLAELLTHVCSLVFLSCKSSDNVPDQLNPLVDQHNLEGPLNGILSAFTHTPNVAWLTVPVDMPMIDEDILRYLISHREHDKLATCFVDSDGEKPEPLLTLWEPHAFMPLQIFFQKGEFSPRKFLMEHSVSLLQPPSQKIYRNVNTPEDLAAFLLTNPDANQ